MCCVAAATAEQQHHRFGNRALAEMVLRQPERLVAPALREFGLARQLARARARAARAMASDRDAVERSRTRRYHSVAVRLIIARLYGHTDDESHADLRRRAFEPRVLLHRHRRRRGPRLSRSRSFEPRTHSARCRYASASVCVVAGICIARACRRDAADHSSRARDRRDCTLSSGRIGRCTGDRNARPRRARRIVGLRLSSGRRWPAVDRSQYQCGRRDAERRDGSRAAGVLFGGRRPDQRSQRLRDDRRPPVRHVRRGLASRTRSGAVAPHRDRRPRAGHAVPVSRVSVVPAPVRVARHYGDDRRSVGACRSMAAHCGMPLDRSTWSTTV